MTLSEGEQADLQRFFPEGCFFHWDGKGEVPVGSAVIWATAKIERQTNAQVCKACNCKDECGVRMDRMR